MGIHRLDNSVNPMHLVTPDRVVVPMPKAFDSPAGIMPYHRMIEAQNVISQAQSHHHAGIVRRADSFESTNPVSTNPAAHAPKLGEVSPVDAPAPRAVPKAKPIEPMVLGGLLDIYL